MICIITFCAGNLNYFQASTIYCGWFNGGHLEANSVSSGHAVKSFLSNRHLLIYKDHYLQQYHWSFPLLEHIANIWVFCQLILSQWIHESYTWQWWLWLLAPLLLSKGSCSMGMLAQWDKSDWCCSFPWVTELTTLFYPLFSIISSHPIPGIYHSPIYLEIIHSWRDVTSIMCFTVYEYLVQKHMHVKIYTETCDATFYYTV